MSIPTMVLVKNDGKEFKIVEEHGADWIGRSAEHAITKLKQPYLPGFVSEYHQKLKR